MGIMGSLYAYLFVALQLEDYALIMGSIGLWVIPCHRDVYDAKSQLVCG
jgi:inner membrane protein involved in colicin E2 resistance